MNARQIAQLLPNPGGAATIARAAARGMKPGRPLQDPTRLCRVAVAMIAATLLGQFLHDVAAQNLLCVGAFLGGIAALMPYQRGRIAAAAWTGGAELAAALTGIVLHGIWWALLPLLAAGFFVGGIMRVVGVGISMRVIVVTIVMIAFAEITPSTGTGGREFALFAGGVAIMLGCQLLPPFEPRHLAQRRAVADLYTALTGPGPFAPALLVADNSLALVARSRDRQILGLIALTEQAEQIGQLLHAVDNRGEGSAADRPARTDIGHRLTTIAAAVRWDRGGRPGFRTSRDTESAQDPLWDKLRRSVGHAEELVAGGPLEQPLDDRRPPTPAELVRDELRPGAPMFRHAVRLAVAGVLGEVIGRAIGTAAGSSLLPAHGFWVCLTVVLILFPDYGDASSRGIARTVGTVAGALGGAALSLLPQHPVLHSALLIVLFLGYLAFRSCGQPWTMLWVVMWISVLSNGPLGAVTRGLATVVGAALALAVFLMLPTWQRARLNGLLVAWLRSQADQIAALCRMWDDYSTSHRAETARATVRTRLARLEFLDASQQAHHEPPDRTGVWTDRAVDEVSGLVGEIAKQVSVVVGLGPGDTEAVARDTRDQLVRIATQLEDLAVTITLDHMRSKVFPARPSAAAPLATDSGIATARASAAIDRLAANTRRSFSPDRIGETSPR
ncbi:FUSC family protein [Nocardia stercoris]|uniref:Integral membrane bound transporter domain-containing protein n=1 Tax=Nocardia stercoris TaxID=2483361 RepID=A0A3M2KTL8_9NOCA|nr:FUSC family protein [Nocardia stercoris]RMI28819.1 hypothetical protein EBN03_28485 [Nocardia stercoris]